MEKTYYLETMGCQMNKLDSELIASRLNTSGWKKVTQQAQASVIIFNTCSVRQHAEDKVISKIGQLKRRHAEDKHLIIAVVGCMVQRLGQDLLDGPASVDIACSPGRIHELADQIEAVWAAQHRPSEGYLALNTDDDSESLEQLNAYRTHEPFDTDKQDENADADDKPFMSFVRVMRGCNNFCHYCVVPYVRGREQSRPLSVIVDECRQLADRGVLEITLLGQTVNSYHYKGDNGTVHLHDILAAIHDINGLERIRFVTSYPRNFNKTLFETMAALPKVCNYLHLPAQSGSDRILKTMNRHYTRQNYLDLLAMGRELIPDLAVAGDFIVGYCGETDEDFEDTCDLVRQAHYKNCFIFKYSNRPGTRADREFPDDVPETVKRQRNTALLDLQNGISEQDNQAFIGQKVSILVEGKSKKPHLNATADASVSHGQLVGRTGGDYIVVFNGPDTLIGTITEVTIIRASALTLFAVQ